MEAKRYAEAEQELRVAVAQSPRNLAAHDLLARLYRIHLDRPSDAFAHEGRALSLRHELAARQRAGARKLPLTAAPALEVSSSPSTRPPELQLPTPNPQPPVP